MQYEIMIPPFKIKDFYEMNAKEAKEHFDWYISQISKRIEMLRSIFSSSHDRALLDFSIESLKPLWAWFIPLVDTKPKSKKEIAEELKKAPDWFKEYIQEKESNKSRFSTETLGFVSDIAIYFAEVLLKNNKSLRWDYVTSPSDFVSVNRPILLGFKFDMDLDPRRIVHVATSKVVDGNKNPDALYDLYNVWTRYI